MFKNYSWDWTVFFEPVSTGEPTNYLGWLLSGLHNTVILALSASFIALVFGIVMGIFRSTQHRGLVALGTVYVAVFRNVPLIAQLFIWYFVLPEIVPASVGTWFKQLPSMTQMMM